MEKANRKKLIRLPAKASFFYILSSMVARGVGVVGTPIFTRLLSPTEYGLYPLYNSWLGIVSAAASLELHGSVMYRGLSRYEGDKDSFLCATYGLFLCSFSAVTLFLLLFSNLFTRVSGLNTGLLIIMLIQIFFSVTLSLYSARARYDYDYKTQVRLNILNALLTPLFSILILFGTSYKGESRILGSAIATVICAFPLLKQIKRGGKPLFNKEIWKYLLRLNLPLLPHYLSVTLILRIGEVVLERVHGLTALGKYSVALSLGLSLSMITGGILSALSPWLTRKLKEEKYGKIREIMLLSVISLFLISLVILAFAPETIKLIAPSGYRDALYAVYPLSLSVIPMFISNAVMSGEVFFEKNVKSSLPAVITAAITLLLALLLLPKLDYRYTGVLLFLSYTTLAILNIKNFKALSGEAVIDYKKCASVFLLAIGYATLLMLFNGVFLSRLLLVIPVLPLLFRYGMKVYKEIREV